MPLWGGGGRGETAKPSIPIVIRPEWLQGISAVFQRLGDHRNTFSTSFALGWPPPSFPPLSYPDNGSKCPPTSQLEVNVHCRRLRDPRPRHHSSCLQPKISAFFLRMVSVIDDRAELGRQSYERNSFFPRVLWCGQYCHGLRSRRAFG